MKNTGFSFNPFTIGGRCPRCGGALLNTGSTFHCIMCSRNFNKKGMLVVLPFGNEKFPGLEDLDESK
jgi:hypothetical protein